MAMEHVEYLLKKPCEKCGSQMVFERTDDKGTVVSVHVKGKLSNPEGIDTTISRDVKMDGFVWVYFKCPKCGWGLCTTNESDDVILARAEFVHESRMDKFIKKCKALLTP